MNVPEGKSNLLMVTKFQFQLKNAKGPAEGNIMCWQWTDIFLVLSVSQLLQKTDDKFSI